MGKSAVIADGMKKIVNNMNKNDETGRMKIWL